MCQVSILIHSRMTASRACAAIPAFYTALLQVLTHQLFESSENVTRTPPRSTKPNAEECKVGAIDYLSSE